MSIFEQILAARGLSGDSLVDFLNPDYSKKHDPFLLPDMQKAVDRLKVAKEKNEKITIYGDYDIDGLTATALLLDALKSFGFKNVDTFMPNRFIEGYGLTVDAIEVIAKRGTNLIITVDCGSLSHKEVERSNSLGIDVIITDHHSVSEKHPDAIAVINPKRNDHKYPFIDLAGVGVAFKLVQALQTCMEGLEDGKEKWLLDLVALGTVCDVVTLMDENRTNVFWGLQVLKKTRRLGLRALMEVARVDIDKLNSRTLGFVLGPRMNASGRLETAQYALNLLTTKDSAEALELAQQLEEMNYKRRKDQDKITEEAIKLAEQYVDDPVLVLSAKDWSHGIVGIVAAKMLEKYKKPTFVMEEMGEESKGSARSYGDFSAVDAINNLRDLLISGGGHKLAAGLKLKTKDVPVFRTRINEYYHSLNLKNQHIHLEVNADVEVKIGDITIDLVDKINTLEPFGHGNPEPILKTSQITVRGVKTMGDKKQHLKINLRDGNTTIEMLAFSAPKNYFVEPESIIDVWYQPTINEWRGNVSLEGKIVNLS